MLRLPNIINQPGWGKHFVQDDITNASLGKEEIINLLGDDIEEVDDNKDDKVEDKDEPLIKANEEEEEEDEEEDEDEDDETDIEDEDEEPDQRKYELITPVPRRAILKVYPDLFKKFPYLEAAYYRDKEFTEVFPTIEDAKKAEHKSSTLDDFENELLSGKTDKVLSTVKELDTEAFHRIVDDYLPALGRVDKEAYNHVLANVIRHTVKTMVLTGQKNKNEALEAAATVLYEFVFGNKEFIEPHNLAKGKSEENEVERDKREWSARKFEASRVEISTRIGNALKSTISQNIDIKKAMTEYVRDIAIDKAMKATVNTIESDKSFKSYLDRLWEAAIKANYSPETLDKIRKAYITKAKTILPTIIKKERIAALKGLGKRTSERVDEEEEIESDNETPERRKKKKSDTAAPVRGGGQSDRERAKKIPRGMSSLDYLNS